MKEPDLVKRSGPLLISAAFAKSWIMAGCGCPCLPVSLPVLKPADTVFWAVSEPQNLFFDLSVKFSIFCRKAVVFPHDCPQVNESVHSKLQLVHKAALR